MGKFLSWLQEHTKHWAKPATSTLISGILSDLTRSRTDLVVENALLRQQLMVLKRQIKRPQLTDPDRFRLVFLSHFTKFWKQSLHIVQPETLLRSYGLKTSTEETKNKYTGFSTVYEQKSKLTMLEI